MCGGRGAAEAYQASNNDRRSMKGYVILRAVRRKSHSKVGFYRQSLENSKLCSQTSPQGGTTLLIITLGWPENSWL